MNTNFMIAVCDDNPNHAETLVSNLKKYFKLKDIPCPDIRCFHSSGDILTDRSVFDIVFLDIELSEKTNGIQIAQKLRQRNPNIIIFYVTSFDTYLDDAMDYHAFRFLTKPVEQARLFRSMDKAIEKYRQFTTKITLKTPDETKILFTRDIVMLEVVLRKVYVYTATETYRSTSNFKFWVNELCERNEFFRPHRCYIVGLKHVTGYDRNEIRLCDGKFKVPVSRDLYSDFDKTMIFYYADISKERAVRKRT